MKALRLLIVAALSLAIIQQPATADPIGEVDDHDLVDLLNYMEIVAERSAVTEPNLPGSIRLVRLHALGECDDSPESCPTQKLYIAVSGTDEEPDRKLYELPLAYGWEFKDWVKAPSSERADDFYVFIVEKKVVAVDISAGWWTTERYQVNANTHSATLSKLP